MKKLLIIASMIAAACNGEESPIADAHVDASPDAKAHDAGKDAAAMDARADARQTDAMKPHDDCTAGPPTNVLRVMTFNIQAAKSYTLEEIADVINEANPDVVGLQEVDMGTQRSGGTLQLDVLEEQTGLSGAFAKAIDYDGGEYGVAILVRGQLGEVKVHALPGAGEARTLLLATVQAKSQEWTFGVTHLGLSEEARTMQVQEIKERFAGRSNRVLVGDMNFEPRSAPYLSLIKDVSDTWLGREDEGYTSPALLPLKRIDYIFADASLLPALCSKVVREVASDHLAVVASLGIE